MSTTSEKKHIKLKKWATIGLVLLLLAVAGRLFLKSDWLFSQLQSFAEEQAETRINGSLRIDSMEGDLLKGFTVVGAVLTDAQGDTIASTDSISVSYSVLSLLRQPYSLSRLKIVNSQLFIKQGEDSLWNVQSLLPARNEPSDTVSTEWAIDSILVENGHVTAESEQYFPDRYIYVDSLSTRLSAGANRDGFYGEIDRLDFLLRENRLPESVAVYLTGSGSAKSYTLESLVLNTGRTLLQGEADISKENELGAELELSPFSTGDLNAYLDSLHLAEQDVRLKLGAKGTLEQFTVNLDASAKGLQSLVISTDLDLSEGLSLTRIAAEVQSFEPEMLIDDYSLPSFQSFLYEGSGELGMGNPEQSRWESTLSLSGLNFSGYEVDQINSPVNFSDGLLEMDATVRYMGEIITASFSGTDLFTNLPKWNGRIGGSDVNLANWLQDPDLESDLNLEVNITGSGFDLTAFDSDIDMILSGNHFQNQNFDEATFSGSIGSGNINGSVMLRLNRSEVEASLNADNWLGERPEFTLEAELNEFNLADLKGFDAFPTYLNGTLEAEGKGKSLETVEVIASTELDSSVVNGEEIEALSAVFEISDQFIEIENGKLESPIASAEFSIRQHITEFTNPENRARITAELKNLRPLAPLFDYETIGATGSLEGNIVRGSSGLLRFDGEADLQNVVIDTLFSSEAIKGKFNAEISDIPDINFTVSLENSNLSGVSIQDVELSGNARISENETDGAIALLFSDGSGSHLRQEGRYRVTTDSLSLTTDTMEFKTELRTLTLKEPFDLQYSAQTVRMDTLNLSHNEDEAYLRLWITQADSLHQVVGLDVENLDLGQLQRTLMDQSYIEGHVTGRVDIDNSPDELRLEGYGHMENLQYQNGKMDSVNVSASINNEWLTAELGAWHDGVMIAESDLKAPFLPGDPLTFEEQFFERDVDGSFSLYSTELSYWFSFLPDGGPAATSGVVTMEGTLDGVAGHPRITGDLSVFAGVFSGISTDYVGVGFNYIHDDQAVDLKGSVIKNASSILSFESSLPFMADLKRAELVLPEGSDSLQIQVNTENFNLALFNSYVDEEIITNLSGVVEGDVSVYGTIDNLKTDGELKVVNGSFRATEPAITLDQLNSSVSFQPEKISVNNFSVRSGPGRLKGSGSITIEDLKPGELDFNLSAQQFRIVNNRDMNALVNMNGSLKGTYEKPQVSGQLQFITGLLNMQNFGERSVERVSLEGEPEAPEVDLYERLSIDVNIQFGEQFLVRNSEYLDMEFALGGEVNLLKEYDEELQMFGTLEGLRGYARPLGKEFELDEALVSFYGPVDNPDLNIRTLYEPPEAAGITIFYMIEGSLMDPEFRFESEPDMELQDIIGYTLFGKPFYELESWEQVIAGSGSSPSASDYALDILLDRVELLASEKLGIDVVQIDNTRSGSSNSTAIKTGWYLNQRTLFAILNEVGGARPKTLFILEYMLRENLELIVTQGDDSREGIDLKWQLDY
jgi:hypothetical protein